MRTPSGALARQQGARAPARACVGAMIYILYIDYNGSARAGRSARERARVNVKPRARARARGAYALGRSRRRARARARAPHRAPAGGLAMVDRTGVLRVHVLGYSLASTRIPDQGADLAAD